MSAGVTIEVDDRSGFCFGVTAAIGKAEEELARNSGLYCLGDIVHNSDEVERLESKGLATITHDRLRQLPRGSSVLLRAHGEPPSTYITAASNGLRVIDATCPVVLRLQQRIKSSFNSPERPQIVIYGKAGHAEVNGLVGQTEGTAIVIDDDSSLDAIDFSRPIALYSQTTKSPEGFRRMCSTIRSMARAEVTCHDTICRQVANRAELISRFAEGHDVVLFVSGKKSSNGRVLFGHCLEANPRTHMIANASEIDPQWLTDARTIGVCGATSTPRWLMEQVREAAERITSATD